MNTEMSDQEKSVMLARLCGWLATDEYFHSYHPPNGKGASVNYRKGYSERTIFEKPLCLTLYNPANMALAANVIQWANKSGLLPDQTFVDQLAYTFTYAKDGQRAALDMVLTLATEAGMVTK